MKLLIRFFLLITLIASISGNGNAQLLTYNCKQYYLNGPNIAWNNYGWDFGDNSFGWGGGNGYSPTWWENTFTDIQNFGGNSVRIWVHCDGRVSPSFSGGFVTGFPANYYSNLDDCLNRAKNHNMMVILSLWDFHLTDYGREGIVTDVAKTNSYINNALIPMVQRYANQCNLIAYEIFNEPEWKMTVPGGGSTFSVSDMQRFVGMCAEAVHNNSDKLVTVGSAKIKYNSSVAPAVGNLWSDAAIQASYGSSQAYLDFYQIHWYDDWGTESTTFCPYNSTPASWGISGKPVLIGESADKGSAGPFTHQQQFDLGYANEYCGTMIWAYSSTSGGGASWSQFNSQMLAFRNAHPSLVDFTCGSGSCCSLPNLGPDVTLCGGLTSVTLNSNAGSTTNKTYKWYRNGSLIGGANGATYGPTSVAGIYVVEVDSLSGACVKKDTIVIRNSLLAPNLGPDLNLCNPSSITLDGGNYGATTVSYQWMKDGSPISGETSRYLNNVRVAGTYRVNVSSSGCATVFDEIVVTSSLPTAVDGCRSGTGTVNLSITNPGLSGTNYNWYANATGGSPLPGGTATTNFTTPSISSTTTYYVQDMSVVSGTVGQSTQLGSNYGRTPTADARYNLWFNTGSQSITIDYVTVWAWFNATNTNYYINLRLLNNSNVVQQSNSVAVMSTTSTGWQQKKIPVGFNVPANVTGWKLDAAGTSMSPVCDLNYASAGAIYPYNSSPTSGAITIMGQNDVTWEPNGYSFFYNWEFSTGTVCSRLPVIAKVGSCSALPVELYNFTASPQRANVLLSWNTTSEINNSHFEIERSIDGINFEMIGSVEGHGNSSSVLKYSFSDHTSPEGLVYYRLKQIDIDGQFHYSDILTTYLQGDLSARIYPVPLHSGEDLHIEFNFPEKTPVVIILKNILGQEQYGLSQDVDPGYNTLFIPSLFLAEGIYFLEITSEGRCERKKILIRNNE